MTHRFSSTLGLLIAASVMQAAANSFEVVEIPLSHPGATVFVADADNDSIPDIFVIDGRTIVVASLWSKFDGWRIPLEENTTAVDVADIDGDGTMDVITVAGDSIFRYRLELDRKEPDPQKLFSLATSLSAGNRSAFPLVMAVEKQGRTVLALPTKSALEYRTIQGELIEAVSLESDSFFSKGLGAPFSVSSVTPRRVAPPDGIEFEVSEVSGSSRVSGPPRLAEDTGARGQRRGTPFRLRRAADEEPAFWPWFSLSSGSARDERVLYALAPPAFTDTFIRMWRPERSGGGDVAALDGIASKRRYPGKLIVPPRGAWLPDFNGDGYTDLLLWKAPAPGASLNALVRAAEIGTWKIELTAHLYSPRKGAYEGRPAARLVCRIPLIWFISPEFGLPLRNFVLRDFDGDGRTDVAFSTDARNFSLWLFKGGFDETPNYTAEFPEPIEFVDQDIDLHHQGKRAVILRSASALYAMSLP